MLTRIGSIARSRKSTLGQWHNSGGTSNVQNTGVVGVALSLFQQWQQGNSQVELTLDVQVKHLVPTLLLREVDHGSTPGQTRVVDQNVQPGLSLLDLLSERITTGFGANIGLESNAETLLALGIGRVELGKLSGNLLEIGELAGGDVDFGTVADVSGGNHLTDTGTTAGYEGDLAIEGEESLSGELGHDFGCCVLGHFCGFAVG